MSSGHGGGRRQVHEEHEEHVNHERWLVSYADMITLLMVLFIVLYAMSQVDQQKFAALKVGLKAGFGAPVSMMHGGDGMLDPGGAIAPDAINIAGVAAGDTGTKGTVDPQAVAQLAKATEQAEVAREVENLKRAQEALQEALRKAGMADGATFSFDERGLIVTIATDEVLFRSGSADLLPGGRKILDALGPELRSLPNRLSVDGHTNNLPINTAEFPSNWELSGDRASGVLRYLSSRHRIPVSRMSATGFADTRPLLPAKNPKSVSVNRRVEVVVLARVDDALGRAVAELGNAKDGAAAGSTGTAGAGGTSGTTATGTTTTGTAAAGH